MELKHLRLAETIDRLGTLAQASTELHLTQSALSHQLRALEEELGVTLFHRGRSALTPTPAGQELLEAARDILPRLTTARQRIDDLGKRELDRYIHGFSPREARRLYDQAGSVADFIHWDSDWPAGSRVLEAGCGVGAQTRIIAERNPEVQFTAVDLSAKSLSLAERSTRQANVNNVSFREADILDLAFPDAYFDHVFVCFVLEHLSEPARALAELRRVLVPGGSITLVEGDHGSTYFYPYSEAAENVVAAQVELQARRGGNANIGRSLRPLLVGGGFYDVRVDPRQIYVDAGKPKLVEGFIRNTFTAMIEGVKDEVVAQGIRSAGEMERGIKDLLATSHGEGTFCYTFFRAVGRK